MWPERRCGSGVVHSAHLYRDFRGGEKSSDNGHSFRCPGRLRDPRQGEIEELRRKLKEAETT